MSEPNFPKGFDLLIDAVLRCHQQVSIDETIRMLDILRDAFAPPKRKKGRPPGTEKYDKVELLTRMVLEFESFDASQFGRKLSQLADDLDQPPRGGPGGFLVEHGGGLA